MGTATTDANGNLGSMQSTSASRSLRSRLTTSGNRLNPFALAGSLLVSVMPRISTPPSALAKATSSSMSLSRPKALSGRFCNQDLSCGSPLPAPRACFCSSSLIGMSRLYLEVATFRHLVVDELLNIGRGDPGCGLSKWCHVLITPRRQMSSVRLASVEAKRRVWPPRVLDLSPSVPQSDSSRCGPFPTGPA